MSEMILKDGDYVYDGAGGFRYTDGNADVLLRRCLTKLKARRGGMPLMPAFGSRLHTLGAFRAAERDGAAARFAAEALADEPVSVLSAAVSERDGAFLLDVRLEHDGGTVGLSLVV